MTTRSRAVARPRGRAQTTVGLTMIEAMLMTPGAQANELTRINNDMRSFATEITDVARAHGDMVPPLPAHATPIDWVNHAKAIAAQPAAVVNDPVITLFRTAWIPLWMTWTAFYAANKDGAWWSNPVSEAEKYQDQLSDIRAHAQAMGIHLQTPGPRQEHPEGLPSWLLPVGVGVGTLAVLSMLVKR